MISLSSKQGDIIDKRYLIIGGTYFSLDQEQADSLANDFYNYTNDSLGKECVLDWTFRENIHSDIDKCIAEKKYKDGSYYMFLEGCVRSEKIYNKTTFRNYKKCRDYPPFGRDVGKGEFISVDYKECDNCKSIYAKEEPEEIKEFLLEIFDKEEKVFLGESYSSDVIGYFNCKPVESSNQLFAGMFYLKIAVYSLQNELNEMASTLLEFGKTLLCRYKKVNFYIELNPDIDRYSFYYGNKAENGESVYLKTDLRNIVQNYYLHNVGWANVICNDTLKLGLAEITDAHIINQRIAGGLLIRVDDAISNTKICDLKTIKRIIYNLIMPRTKVHPVSLPFRGQWECIPVFKEELRVDQGRILFEHFGKLDLKLIEKTMGIDLDHWYSLLEKGMPNEECWKAWRRLPKKVREQYRNNRQ